MCSDKLKPPQSPSDYGVVEEEPEITLCPSYSYSKSKSSDYFADMLERRCGSATGPTFTSSASEILAKRGKTVKRIGRKSEAVSKDAFTLHHLAQEMHTSVRNL